MRVVERMPLLIDTLAPMPYHGNMEYELPLFPLNTVLFPGMPLTLHIFEDRYKQMINECRDSREPFGVVLIREGVEALGPPAEPHLVGCAAEIAQIQTLEEGRMNVLALGRDRFQIRELRHDRPYLTALVEEFPLAVADAREASTVSRRLRPWVEAYLALLSEAGDVEFDVDRLPGDPQTLAYLAATILQIPNPQKQELLATPAAASMLSDMHVIYRHELPVLRLLLQTEEHIPAGPGSFSLS